MFANENCFMCGLEQPRIQYGLVGPIVRGLEQNYGFLWPFNGLFSRSQIQIHLVLLIVLWRWRQCAYICVTFYDTQILMTHYGLEWPCVVSISSDFKQPYPKTVKLRQKYAFRYH